jgi:BioD-like phosphotransacetylase family protein
MGVSLMKVGEEDSVVAVAKSSAATLAMLEELNLDEPAGDEVAIEEISEAFTDEATADTEGVDSE